MREYVSYQGNKYFIQSSGRYYQCGNKEIKPRLLHRKVWTDTYGAIPKGYVIHHKDHDWRNNNISNLEMISVSKHASDHLKERFVDTKYRDKNKKQLEKAQEEAKKWHASNNGLKWHSQHAKDSWEDRKKEAVTCVICGKESQKHFKGRKGVRFCSRKCQQKSFYASRRVKALCLLCGIEFSTYKYRIAIYCSRMCSNKHRFSKAR